MKDKVIIDTSVWIEYLQNRDAGKLSENVDELLAFCDVYVPKIVIAELIQGAHSEKELSAIRDFMEAFHVISESEDTWYKAGKLSFNLKKKGKTINLADCYIAVIAQEYQCAVMTMDKHFKDIHKESGLKLIGME
jgi:predicted nucleic acid-binding protein